MRRREDGRADGTLRQRVVALHEAAGAPHHEKPHEFAPVVRVRAFFEGRETVDGALVATGEFIDSAVTIGAEVFFGPEADTVFGREKKPELVGEIEVGLVVGCGRK